MAAAIKLSVSKNRQSIALANPSYITRRKEFGYQTIDSQNFNALSKKYSIPQESFENTQVNDQLSIIK